MRPGYPVVGAAERDLGADGRRTGRAPCQRRAAPGEGAQSADAPAQRDPQWGGRRRAAMSFQEEREFPAPWAEPSADDGMLIVAPLRAALAQCLGRPLTHSVVYRSLARHGWRKAPPHTRHPEDPFLNDLTISLAGLGRAASLRIACVDRHTARSAPGIASRSSGQIFKLSRRGPRAFAVTATTAFTTSQAESISSVTERRANGCPIWAQSAAAARAMARICNDERAPSGAMSGHDRKTLSLRATARLRSLS